ncbi:MAG TPA: tetratricopeptide repeat protein [Burkholderiales bacterium]|nr:tetratricopeptide repeat protein [Burkholderiales bacterium]
MLRRLLQSAARDRARRLNGRGIGEWQRGDLPAAERTLRAALKKGGQAGTAANLGMVLAAQGRPDEALVLLRRAVELDPGHAGARINLAALLHQGGAVTEAVQHLREALRIDPGNSTARANLLKPLMDLCDWPGVEAEVRRLRDEAEAAGGQAGSEAWADAILPFESLLLPFTPSFQLRVARRHAARYAAAVEPLPRPAAAAGSTGGRLRIGYLSADFHDHATAHLAAGLFAAHDRTRVEVVAYCIDAPQAVSYGGGEAYRRRIVQGCDRFVDATASSSRDLARRIAADGIHVLVDMKGYTGGSRPEVPAMRPAPLQVSFLGYPGTMGAEFMDYLIADRVVIAPGTEDCYSEALAFMPGSYQVNDRQAVAEAPGRAACGLPEQGFVFCCFNQLYKIDASVFAAWMRILAAVPGSVLWLLAGQAVAQERLRAAAAAAGVDPGRLVFAPYAAKAAHLARHAHADLFLDTLAVNAHTTASDALWAGVPVLTSPGRTFASRVGASLLTALELPEGVASDLDDYERSAIALADGGPRLADLGARLAANRATHSLFDTAAYARALEGAFARMWSEHCQGRRPTSFQV